MAEVLLVSPKSLLYKVSSLSVSIDGVLGMPASVVRNLGVLFDPSLNFYLHISFLTKIDFFPLRDFVCLHRFMTSNDAYI